MIALVLTLDLMKYIDVLNKIIEYTFYTIVFLVPLALVADTSELFEFNKLWLTFIFSLVILASWISKMLIKRQFKIQRTPLDIPIVLFLLSQVIATVFSIDRHVSLWGYYSRFNGGLLSIIAYIFLYYAFVSNFKENAKTIVKRLIFVALSSAVIVSLWGLPSHFGYDPTCLAFRGTFDVSCWTSDFQPKIRIFSTLGQPDWLAAYLAILLPIPVALFIKSKLFKTLSNKKQEFSKKDFGFALLYFLMLLLFYIDLSFSKAKSGFLGIWFAALFFAGVYVFIKLKTETENVKKFSLDIKLLALAAISMATVTFFIGTSIIQLDTKFTYEHTLKKLLFKSPPTKSVAKPVATLPPLASRELGGTDSSKIRQIVWKGAIDAWLHNPIFGTGVETFAFTYYKYRPAEHNLTSEWRYLYNKAHNEYLNYLATTGVFGLLTYLSMIGLFLFLSLKFLWKNKNEDTNNRKVLILALVSGYVSILVTNFFGFSVVIVNIFMFLIPALVFTLANLINYEETLSFSWTKKADVKTKESKIEEYVVTKPIWAIIAVIVVISGYLAFTLINFWNADRDYAKGYNLDRVNNFQTAYPLLNKAVSERGDEPTFKDELAINNAVLAIALLQQKPPDEKTQKQTTELVQKLAGNAVSLSDQITSAYPNNVVFWKTRVRIFYTLAQADNRYLQPALAAIKKTAELAPTDAEISYNLGILYGQSGDAKNAAETLKNTVKLKQDYTNAYYALGIFYHQLAINNKGQIVNEEYHQKAIDTMKFLLKNVAPGDQRALEALKTWGAGQK